MKDRKCRTWKWRAF